MTAPGPRRGFDWETAARNLGESLDEYCAIVVVGVDPVATGRVAIGIGRAQAARRRVAVGDLFAESPPIQELVHSEDPHGIVDSFLYGVSLSRIAHEVPDAGQLFVMPSGTEPPDYDEILPNPRWHRLTAGFREVGALLVLAAPASAPHIETLVGATDGAILVGEGVPRQLPVSLVIASVREPRPEGERPPAPPPAKRPRWSTKRVAAISGVLLTILLGSIAIRLGFAPFLSKQYLGRKPDTSKGLAAVVSAATPDTAVRTAAADPARDTTNAPVTTITVPIVVNPGDSAAAAGFAVELVAANTQAGAILKLQQEGKNLPAATFAPVLDSRGFRWFKVIGGAYAKRAGADSLLAELRKRKVLDPDKGSVTRVPFAFRIDSAVPAAAVPAMLTQYAAQGQPVYALWQTDGTAWLCVGAFESVDQSGLYAESLRGSTFKAVLVYRKGRTF